MIEGDTDRSGVIDLDDLVGVVNANDTAVGDGVYEERFDFGQKGIVSIDDLVSTVTNNDSLISIEKYSKGG